MELALIFVLELFGLALAVALARAAFNAPSVGVHRVVAAVERAARAFFGRTRAGLFALVGVTAGIVLAAGLWSGQRELGVASALGVLFGALLAATLAVVASVLGGRASGAVVTGAASRFDRALGAAVRGAGASGILAQSLAALGVLGLLGAGHWLHRGPTPPTLGELAARSALALPGFALGAALVASLLEATAGGYRAAARAGENWAILRDPSLVRQPARNPGLVSSLVGERLVHGAGSASLFAASVAAAVGAAALGLGGGATAEPRWLGLPLLLWGFGLVANGAGLFVVRSLEAQGAGPALVRGQLSAGAVWLVGLLGGAYWLYPGAWAALAGAGAVGLAGGTLAPYTMARAFARRRGPLRETLDALESGAATTQAAALGFGLGHAAIVLLLLAATGGLAAWLGKLSGLPRGDELGLMVALFAAMSWSPFALAVEGGAAIADTAQGISSMSGADATAYARIQRLSASCETAAAMARSQLTLTRVLGALAVTLGARGASPSGQFEVTPWTTLLGVAMILLVAGVAARRAARGAREVSLEIERQLATTVAETPGEGRAPSYRACEEAAARVGLSNGLWTATLALGGPVLLGITLRLVYRESGPRLAAEALATFVAGAAVTALGVALAVDGARAVSAGARRASRPEGDPATHAASVTGSALAEILGGAAGPAVCTAALIAASLAILARNLIP
jgi:Na+/H+-translocating membrane pyrophosphatase